MLTYLEILAAIGGTAGVIVALLYLFVVLATILGKR